MRSYRFAPNSLRIGLAEADHGESVLWRTVIDAAPLALNTHYCVALKSYINFTEGSAKLP